MEYMNEYNIIIMPEFEIEFQNIINYTTFFLKEPKTAQKLGAKIRKDMSSLINIIKRIYYKYLKCMRKQDKISIIW